MRDVIYDFSGRVAVVTGGANGIGAEVARHYHAAGAQVAIWDIAQPEGLDIPHRTCRVDISDLAQIEAAVTDTVTAFGGIDFLSHNAGFAGSTVPVTDYDPAEWERIVNINLTGTFLVCQAALPHLLERGGNIVNTASTSALRGLPWHVKEM